MTEYEVSLRRGTFDEGDSLEFGRAEKQEADVHQDDVDEEDVVGERRRRREEMEWREKMTDRLLGVRTENSNNNNIDYWEDREMISDDLGDVTETDFDEEENDNWPHVD